MRQGATWRIPARWLHDRSPCRGASTRSRACTQRRGRTGNEAGSGDRTASCGVAQALNKKGGVFTGKEPSEDEKKEEAT